MATRFLTLDGKIAKDTRTGMPVAITTNIFTSVTYDVLKTMRDNGHLLSGEQYRIVDFVTTTTQENTQSAGHPFDIIVVADSANTLNENARAVAHAGDTYFANSKLSAWEVKYCLDNDKTRFWWADETNGKGVIYYMKDEYDNECPYDFKNIQFKRWATDDEIDNDDKFYSSWNDTGNDFRWCYTFMANGMSNDTWADGSILNPYKYMHDGSGSYCVGNSIKPYIQLYNDSEDTNEKVGVQWLNSIVLYGNYEDSPYLEDEYNYNYMELPQGNEFLMDCRKATLKSRCTNNHIGANSYAIKFGASTGSNSIGADGIAIEIGDYVRFSSVGAGCNNCFVFGSSITIGSSCSQIRVEGYDNNIGNSSYNVSLLGTCYRNTLLQGCSSIQMTDCYDNYIGIYCSNITFGSGCNGNVLQSSNRYISLGEQCQNNYIANGVSTVSIAKGLKNGRVLNGVYAVSIVTENAQNVVICGGVRGNSSSSIKQIETPSTGIRNTTYVRTANDVTITV